MPKLKLNVEELTVDGFATVAPEAAREGTVRANAATPICTAGSCGHICP